MKYLSSMFLAVFILCITCNQVLSQKYFQQKVDFEIKAKLDTINHVLAADCKISYTNNSSETLNEIYLHLWWNAVSDKQSPYASQKLERSSYDFHFSSNDQMGGYRNLIIRQNDKQLETKIYNYQGKVTPDILAIQLDEPCSPGNTVIVELVYKLDIPYRFSRFGYQDKVYSFTQWYPKPAVFDKSGWHPMPYLDIGEFYYDFGDYEVEIDLPEGLQIASSGIVSDRRNVNDREIIILKATSVTDFACFISSEFIREERIITIDRRTIQLNVFRRSGNKSWDNAMDYLERALHFYDDNVGPYPYPQVSIVDGSDNSSGGMEYPMITIIDYKGNEQVLDHLIAHEIGHNWFYAILANNERKYAWLDEGLNTYFEQKYNDQFYKESVYDDLLPPLFASKNSEADIMTMLLFQLQRSNRDLPINTPSERMDLFNYGAMSYQKMALSLEYLSSYLGEDIFNTCIKSYYNQWKFQHPGPESIKNVFESVSGKDLEWFFGDLLNTKNRFDYEIGRVEGLDNGIQIEVRQKEKLNIPYHISVFDNSDSLIHNQWMDGLDSGKSVLKELIINPGDIGRVSINGAVPFLDNNSKNNHYFLNNTISKRSNIRFNFLFKTSDSRYSSINWFPSLMANGYDGLMTGIQVTNEIFPSRSFKYYFNVAYGFGSKSPVGIFSLKKDIYTGTSKMRKWQLGLYGKQFHYREYLDYNLKYRKIVPHIKMYFSKGMRQNHSLEYKVHWLETEFLEINEIDIASIREESSLIHQLNFNSDWHKRLSQNNLKVGLEYQDYNTVIEDEHYLRFNTDFKSSIAIAPTSKFDLRLFGTYFILNTQRESASFSSFFTRGSFGLSGLGNNDYLFDSYYFARSDQSGFFSRQLDIRDGGFKTSSGNVSNVGKSNNWAIGVNLKSDLPWGIFQRLKLRPFLDLALVSTKATISDPLEAKLYYSGGMAIEFVDFLGFYIPILNSSEIDQFYDSSSIFSRISFKLDLARLNAWNYLDNPALLLN